MIWASWGLKDKLLADPDIWLCHQCGDCTSYCPRGVKPGDVLSSLRQQAIVHYARPQWLARLLNKPWFLVLAFAIPMTIIHLILLAAGTIKAPEGPINYSEFFPHAWLNSFFGGLVLLVLIGLFFSLRSYVKDLKNSSPGLFTGSISFGNWVQVFKEVMSHKKFNTCTSHKYRYWSHLMVFWGFVILLFVTLMAILSVILWEYPIPLWNPIKILGNLGMILLLTGMTLMIIKRIFSKSSAGNSNYFDWVFLLSFYLLIVTGGLTEIARFANWHAGYYYYTIHLTFVWFIIIFAPYTKFAHVIFRTVAMAYAGTMTRN